MTEDALLDLLGWLDARDYGFVPPTPLTHARAIAGGAVGGDPLRALFGWSATVRDVAPDLLELMTAAGIAAAAPGGVRSSLRVARLGGRLLFHSAFPTAAADAVFLGPDSYRFARLIAAELRDRRGGGTLVDVGTGAGAGLLVAAGLAHPARAIGTDVNPAALRLARVNARFAGCAAEFVETDCLATLDGAIDLAVANPPFLIDDDGRHYRHGGDLRGCRVALDMATAALERLAPGGRLILYTGSPIVAGTDALHRELAATAADHGCDLRYEELDPDIFGEELDRPAYAGVERIALVAAIADRR